MSVADVVMLILLLAGTILSATMKKLTWAGALSGLVIALLIYRGIGTPGVAAMATFFILAVIATRWKGDMKRRKNLTREVKGLRDAGQVWANAGAAALFGTLAIFSNHHHLGILVAACFSSAVADTLSSELGTIYGRRFYNIVTFRPDARGKDGVISLEGTLIGILGSILVACAYSSGSSRAAFFIIVFSGTVGNVADSLLGATAERKGMIGNNMVNFANTLVAAASAELLYQVTIHHSYS